MTRQFLPPDHKANYIFRNSANDNIQSNMVADAVKNADVVMIFDECTAYPATLDEAASSMRLSLRWAERSKKAHEGNDAALFGIVQGGTDPGLRRESAVRTVALDFDGYGIGGLSVGEERGLMLDTVAATTALLPAERPRYLMGVGTPDDLIEAVARGIDMFDCVMPTRNGRHGVAFTRFGQVNLRNARHADDPRPLDETSSWLSTRSIARAYLHHLVKSGETLGAMLLSEVNIAYYQRLMQELARRRTLSARRRRLSSAQSRRLSAAQTSRSRS